MNILLAMMVFVASVLVVGKVEACNGLTESEIKKRIELSIRSYVGNCPCPYSRDARGYRCGKRSAWSRPGGESPLCYKEDVCRSVEKARQ